MWTRTRRLVLLAMAGLTALVLVAASPAAETPTPVATSSAAPLAIIDVEVSPDPVRANQPVSVTIHTTPNAVLLQARVFSHAFTIPKSGDGLFYGAGSVPWWARFLHGSFSVTFIATDASGATAQMDERIRM